MFIICYGVCEQGLLDPKYITTICNSSWLYYQLYHPTNQQKGNFMKKKKKKQAGAELCQAQVKLGVS